ncbi:MAG TPA: serine/threonine-protein kinase [Gemmataceae bacterium]|nr:serine/threonine-protein kinase [Gemmataceae bacterium]
MSSDPSPKRPRRAVRVGKYEVVAHIATGGMGAVYKAIDSVLKREVALKVLPPDMASKPNALERFRREARNAARLRHENIVTIYEFDQSGTTFYLAMEFIEGIDLQEYIERKGRLDPEEARIITIQAARALEHAHAQGVVHRDIKPSNFLVTRKGDKLVVKMSDFGLARETSDEEARVTREGHTVGTVDYMSPEQARDCGSADIRSDIYSLGCSLFHTLTGRPPFPEGSIPERLFKHAQAEPPDLRQLNPRVSEAFCAVVRRMLLKEADDRYQTPGALLKDLIRLESATAPLAAPEVLAGLARAAGEEPAEESQVRRRAAAAERSTRPPPPMPPPRPRGRRGEPAPVEAPDPDADGAPASHGPWLWVLGGGVVALVLAVVGVILGLRTPAAPPPDPVTQGPPRPAVTPAGDSGRGSDPGARPPDPPKGPGDPPKPVWPLLYEPSVPLALETLRKEFRGPWEGQGEPGPTVPVLRVSRQPSGAGAFASLEAACAAAPADRLTVIEIADNGPIFQAPVAVADRSLVIRAARGYRPLLVWDVEKGKDEGRGAKEAPAALLALARGNLTLDRLDLVVKWGEAAAAGRPFLVRVTDGDLLARDCTFSLSGRQPADLGAVRFERSDPGGPPRAAAGRCRLSRCVARGPGLVALDLDSPGADVLLDGCLFVGTDQPLLRVAGRSLAPAVLRILRSTLVADQTLLQVRRATAADTQPDLHVRTWDALLTRGGTQAGGQMVVLVDSSAARMKWQAVNCLYTGWRTLLTSADRTAADRGTWQAVWQRSEGELALAPPWPAVVRPDPAEAAIDEYRPAPAPASLVGYAATSTSDPGPLGCDFTALPPARTNWLALTYDPYPAPALEAINDAAAPPVPASNGGRYQGGHIDLTSTPDLGAFLDEMARTKGLGPRVVLHLSGAGEYHTRPIRVRGSSLVLYFEPVEGGARPLTLMPHKDVSPEGDALVEVDGGGLDVIGGEVRFPDFHLALMPPYALKVRGGDLRLFRCRLYGPLKDAPPTYRGLIRFEGGSSDPAPAKPHGCTLNESVLVSGRSCADVGGGGARLRLQQCVILSGDDAIHFDPGATAKARLDVQCLLDQTTVAARHAVVRLSDAPQLEGSVEPIVMETRSCTFLNPFTDAPGATLLVAEDGALSRGLLVWQGGGNAFDKRLAAGAPAWAKLWGRSWERHQTLDVPLKGTIDLGKPELDRLALPPGLIKPPPGEEKRPPPGADFELLGLMKKPAKPPR